VSEREEDRGERRPRGREVRRERGEEGRELMTIHGWLMKEDGEVKGGGEVRSEEGRKGERGGRRKVRLDRKVGERKGG